MAPQQAEQSSAIATDFACARCGYNLRTLLSDGCCPECALPVEQSLAMRRRRLIRVGPDLVLQGDRWLKDLAASFALYVIAAVMYAFVVGLSIYQMSVIQLIIFYASFVLIFIAGWRITRASNEPARFRVLRLLFRALIIVWFITDVGGLPLTIWMPSTIPFMKVMHLDLLRGFATVAATIVFFAYVSNLAARLRKPILAWGCRRLSLLGFVMIISVIVVNDVWWRMMLSWFIPSSPEMPVLGPVGVAFLNLKPVPPGLGPSPSWMEVLLRPDTLWVGCSLAVMIAFGVALFRITGLRPVRRSGETRSPGALS